MIAKGARKKIKRSFSSYKTKKDLSEIDGNGIGSFKQFSAGKSRSYSIYLPYLDANLESYIITLSFHF